jgi:CheY-like chemotaxis protein
MATQAQKLTIIVVEDTYDDQQVVSHMLRHHGMTVHVAEDGEACLRLLATVMPDVIVTDLAMPLRDGWQTLAAIRADPRLAHLPVAVATAYHSAEVAEEALRVGFDAYFAKPLHPEAFVARLRELGRR